MPKKKQLKKWGNKALEKGLEIASKNIKAPVKSGLSKLGVGFLGGPVGWIVAYFGAIKLEGIFQSIKYWFNKTTNTYYRKKSHKNFKKHLKKGDKDEARKALREIGRADGFDD